MAQIREKLTLEDKFSATFQKYVNLAKSAYQATTRTDHSTKQLQKAHNAAAAAAKKHTEATNQMAKSQKNAASAASNLAGRIMRVAGALVSLRAAQGILNLADTLSQTTARLDMMNDGLQTTAELTDMVFRSAQRARGSYADTADLVAKLGNLAGDAFGSSREIVAFAEQVNKQIALSGTSAAGAQAAILQLTQALSSGALRGEELNSILEQTPTIAQTIAKYLNMTTGQMRELASQGGLTASVVKNALFAAADETNRKFEQMPMTWSQIWTQFQNQAIHAFQPVLAKLTELGNSPQFQQFVNMALSGISAVANAALAAFGWIADVATAIADNWGTVGPIFMGVAAAAWAFNAAVSASPLGWIAMILGVIIGIVYGVVAAFNELTDSTVSATGIICGAIMTAAAFIGNLFVAVFNLVVDVFVGIYNTVAMVANFLANVFIDPIGSIIRLFADMADTVLSILQSIASAIDSVFGSNLAGTLQGWRNGLGDAVESTFGKGNEVMAKLDASDLHLGRFEYGSAFNLGYNFGQGIDKKVSGAFNTNSASPTGTGNEFQDIYYKAGQMANPVSGIGDSVGGSLGSDVGAIKKEVQMSEEDLKSLVDLAERQYVNKINLTAQTPVINVSGQNTGNTAADRRALANAIRDILLEQKSAASFRSTAQPT